MSLSIVEYKQCSFDSLCVFSEISSHGRRGIKQHSPLFATLATV